MKPTPTRPIRKVYRSKPTIEGAGVHLRRAFGFGDTASFDPFLLLDDFRSDRPSEYLKGFPWHPHRGIETITYLCHGSVEHGDSLGNQGVIGPGDVQWMTAGSGIIHQEMPKGNEQGRMGGFQLWANLPAAHKMMDPRYRDVTAAQIPLVNLANGVSIRIVAGAVQGTRGPVQDIVTEPSYLDVTLPPRSAYTHPTPVGHTVIAYVIEGKGCFCDTEEQATFETGWVENTNLVLFEDGAQVTISTDQEPVRFLLLSGKPIREPVAWYGPIVMNTRAELQLAFQEYQEGTFVKTGSKIVDGAGSDEPASFRSFGLMD